MAIDTRPNLDFKKFEQCSGDTLQLSGTTYVYGDIEFKTVDSFIVSDGNQGINKIMGSDATGKGTWKTSTDLGLLSGGTNGLSKIGSNIQLGGNIIKNTEIDLNGYCYTLSNTSPLMAFEMRPNLGDFLLQAPNMLGIFGTGYTCLQNVNGTNKATIALCSSNGSATYCTSNSMLICGGTFLNIKSDYTLFTDGNNNGGVQYAADYSGTYTDRSLVDKGYVNSVISGLTGGSGGINWNGTTVNGIGTYVDANTICSQPNLTYSASVLSAPISCGTTCVSTPISCGTTCVRTPISCASTCVSTPVSCGTTCVVTPISCGTTCVRTPISCASTCVSTPISCGTTCVTTPISCGTTCVVTPVVRYGNTASIYGELQNDSTHRIKTENVTGGWARGLGAWSGTTKLADIGFFGSGPSVTYSYIGKTYNDTNAKFYPDGTTALYYNNSLKFSTTSVGTCTTGVNCATTCVRTPISCGTTCIASPKIIATSCMRVNNTSSSVTYFVACSNANDIPAATFNGYPAGTGNQHTITISNKGTGGGKYYGLYSDTYSTTAEAEGRSYGVVGIAGNRTAGYNFGVLGKICGTNSGAGVLGTTGSEPFGFSGIWAGYFCGPVYMSTTSCAVTCMRSAVVCATTAFRTSGSGLRYCGGTGCGSAVDWIATSDCRIKKNITPITSALSKVDALCGVCYNLCEDDTPDMGLIAQDVICVEPRLVAHGDVTEEYKKYGIEDELLSLKYDKMAGLFVEAIKELKKENELLKNEIIKIKQQINNK